MWHVSFFRLNVVPDIQYRYAVIVARHKEQWVFCKHKDRTTWELPGGTRDDGEAIISTARRELYEETGALQFTITPLCSYTAKKGSPNYGLLCYADISSFGPIPPMEMERIAFFDTTPDMLTYPEVHPKLLAKALELIPQ